MRYLKFGSILFFLAICLFTFFSFGKTALTLQPDFSIFYQAGRDMLKGISPYADKTLFTAYNYPIITAFLFLPFVVLPYHAAQIVFSIFSFFSVLFCVYIALFLLGKKVTIMSFTTAASLALLAFPTKFTFGMGQVNCIAYCFVLAGFLLYQKKMLKSSIFFLLIGLLLKPILGLLLVVFIFEKNWYFLGKVIFFALSLILIFPILINQPFANWIFIQNILHQSMIGREIYYNQGLLGFISRITPDLTLRFFLNIIGAITLLAITFIKNQKQSLVSKFSLLSTALLLIDPLSWQHHFVFLLLPFLFVWNIVKKKHNFLLFFCFVFAYFLAMWNFKTPQNFISFPYYLFLSNQFYAVCILFVMQIIV